MPIRYSRKEPQAMRNLKPISVVLLLAPVVLLLAFAYAYLAPFIA